MNKTEKLICLFLGMALVWCFLSNKNAEPAKDTAAANEVVAAESATNAVSNVTVSVTNEVAKAVEKELLAPVIQKPSVAEEIVILENDDLKLELTTWGAGVKSATLKKYALKAGDINEDNPSVVLDYSRAPLGAMDGLKGIYANAAYEIKEKTATSVVFVNTAAMIERNVTLGANYKVTFEDKFLDPSLCENGSSISLGVMAMGSAADDILSIDAKSLGDKGEVVYYGTDDDTALYPLLAGGIAGGCGCNDSRKVRPDDPQEETRTIANPKEWIALKNRFFVTALTRSTQENKGFATTVRRKLDTAEYRPDDAAVKVLFGAGAEARTTEFFIGPKEQSLLAENNMKEVMEFGFWSFLCYPMVWILNMFNKLIPNYGIGIILLTILVRLVFWPLTRKSTEGMKKMQEIQPLLKELQAKFKDNPQRLQQETWALYREKKVNPLSSCLPMLIQIPIFIALFNVLRSMVELRYAGFLWIDDLSAPEHLFAAYFPFGGLNILPILMAATMFLQSKLTPSAGDQNQQKMMMVFMPIMMLFMFYNFASALSLYWTVSQILSIIQMWMMRREAARKAKVLEPEVIDPPSPTRQMRRHG